MNCAKILVLDDPHEGVQLLHTALHKKHVIVWARSIAQALEELAKPTSPFDLIICGVNLESESLFDFLKAAKSEQRNQKIPFLCFRCSDSNLAKVSDPQIEKTSRILGATDYIAISEMDNDPVELLLKIERNLPQVATKRRGSMDV